MTMRTVEVQQTAIMVMTTINRVMGQTAAIEPATRTTEIQTATTRKAGTITADLAMAQEVAMTGFSPTTMTATTTSQSTAGLMRKPDLLVRTATLTFSLIPSLDQSYSLVQPQT
jgi:hypothetical protein